MVQMEARATGTTAAENVLREDCRLSEPAYVPLPHFHDKWPTSLCVQAQNIPARPQQTAQREWTGGQFIPASEEAPSQQ